MQLHSSILAILLVSVDGFNVQPTNGAGKLPMKLQMADDRRSFLLSGAALLAGAAPASAAIDVSGIRVEGTNSLAGTPTIKDQLKTYDGSGATRIDQLRSMDSSSSKPAAAPVPTIPDGVAVFAQRYSMVGAKLSSLGIGLLSRYEDSLTAPAPLRSVGVRFEFPSDWLQLDRMSGGIQFVDQRNGDKLYVLRAKLPEETTLETVPKKFFGEAIFSPQGSVVKNGNEVDEFKVAASSLSSFPVPCKNGTCEIPRRRMTVKYVTVTGNGLRVERKALVDAYQVESDVYMMMASSTAVKFDAKGRERETIDSIAESFRIER